MNRMWIAGVALIVAFAFPSVMLAHEGHAHRVMGTVSAITATQLDIRTGDGTMVVVALDAKTVYQSGKTKVDAKLLKVGGRVVVSALLAEGAKIATAQTVQLAVPATTASR